MKVMLGIWLEAEVSNHEGCPWLTEPIPQTELDKNKIKNKQEISRAIRLAKEYPNIIVAINVGNEALVEWNDHMVSQDSIISYVRKVKKAVDQQVTVADNYKWWALEGKTLAKELDFLGVHAYPAWEGRGIDEAMPFTIENIQEVADSLSYPRIVIAEAGWATIASEFGDKASEENQKQYYNELMAWAQKMNITTFFFEAFDEDWKGNPENPLGAEKHWGLFTVDRKAKLVMYNQYPDLVPKNK
jgi:exo-beta-1,3-glucanase (GH17 family)